jgi:hypothetical protein
MLSILSPVTVMISLVNMLLILSPDLILQEPVHSAIGGGWCRPLPTFHWSTFYSFYLSIQPMGAAGAGPCQPFIGQHAINFISRIDVAGAGAFSQWEWLVPAPADLS